MKLSTRVRVSGSIKGALERNLGGKWVYDRKRPEWRCDDGRVVRACCSLVDMEWELNRQYWLYEDGKAPRRAEEYLQ